ncbi:MFS transporter [Dactylosporangium sp. NPDC049742]|uniref:MFS transporter n=1 Tax=Dactylosporangium sp. NPDC049742 TaxID=3154737 RepID=UPI003449FEDB
MSSLGSRYWRLFGASATSNLADGIGRTALPLLAATYTRDPVLISGLYSLAFLPWLVFALPAGALVDRGDRRRAMVVANLVRAGVIGVVAAAAGTGHASVPLLYAAVFTLGAAETVYDSAANALLPQLVGPGQLDRGNSWLVTAETVGQLFLGAPVGALLFAVAVSAPLAVNATGFALCALIMLTVPGSYRPSLAPTGSLRADMRDGLRWMLRHPLLRGLTVLFGFTAAFQAMSMSVLVLFALDVLQVGSRGYGLLLLAGGVGGLLGGLAAPYVGRLLGRTGTLSAVALCTPPAVVGMGLTSDAVSAFALFLVTACLVMIGNVLTMSLRQTLIPEELFGRVQGVWRTAVWGGIPVGGFAGGVLADATDVPTVFVVAGLGYLATGVAVTALLFRHRALTAAAAPAGG